MKPHIEATLLLAAAAVLAPLLMGLSSRRRHSSHPVLLHYFLLGVSAAYIALMPYVLTFLTSYLSSLKNEHVWTYFVLIMFSVVLIQFLRAKADMAALAVAAITSPVSDDGVDTLKIRPSMTSLVYPFWVAALVIYSIVLYVKTATGHVYVIEQYAIVVAPLWVLDACRNVLRFVIFERAAGSFAVGRSAQLVSGHMAFLLQQNDLRAERQLPADPVPSLIVTGERNQDVEESPMGYRVKDSALEGEGRRLVTLDRVWCDSGHLLTPELKDLCLSFALFKCLRRSLARHHLAEAGSSWAFRFVADGMLGQEGDHERIFRVMAGELSFASDFYYSFLPVASLGTLSAALHFLLSLLISCLIIRLTQVLFPRAIIPFPIPMLLITIIATVNVITEVSEMLTGLRSNCTKISMIGHYIRCRHDRVRRMFSWLLRSKSPKQLWKDEIRQSNLLKPNLHLREQSWVLRLRKQLFLLPGRNCHEPAIKVPLQVKAAILDTFRRSGGQLSAGTATLQRRCQAYIHDITWACHVGGGGEVTTTTDVLLVWHIATSLFEIRCSSQNRASASSSARTDSMIVAQSLSCYCAYLREEAPDLLPGDSAWTKCRYEVVKKGIEDASKSKGAVTESGDFFYENLIDSFSAERCHDVLNKGSRLGNQLVEEAERPIEGENGLADGGEDAVWELLAEFWSEFWSEIEVLQRGGELVTLFVGAASARRHHH
ncbi:unnamed protein product [Urochloa humidicola]